MGIARKWVTVSQVVPALCDVVFTAKAIERSSGVYSALASSLHLRKSKNEKTNFHINIDRRCIFD